MSTELLLSNIVQYDFVIAGDIFSESLGNTGGWIIIFQDCLQEDKYKRFRQMPHPIPMPVGDDEVQGFPLVLFILLQPPIVYLKARSSWISR